MVKRKLEDQLQVSQRGEKPWEQRVALYFTVAYLLEIAHKEKNGFRFIVAGMKRSTSKPSPLFFAKWARFCDLKGDLATLGFKLMDVSQMEVCFCCLFSFRTLFLV